jgi:signal transduction histidine kinase
MPEGGVLDINTASHENDEQPDRRGAHVRLTVTDTGQGIPFHLRASVFEPFFTTKQHGTGIGLASVASTVQRLGGRLSIETQEGAGTRVHVDLPLLKPPAAAVLVT